MKKISSLKVILSLALSALVGTLSAQTWQLVTPAFEQTETVVAGYVVEPSSFSNQNDVAAEVQTMLNNLNNCGGDTEDQGHGGGVLYFKSGHYKFRSQISVPKGVTIRGDWQKPVKGQSLDKGAVFEVYVGANKTDQGDAFIKLHSGASVHGITFWYPEQTSYANPTPYSHTILLGKGYGWSAEFNFVRNVTFVNAYSGIYYQDDGGTCPNVNGVYGTPMVRGVEIDNIVDIGRLDKLDFSPDYWINSGFTGAPTGANATSFKTWLRNNGVGVIMRRNDWSYTCYLTVEGYNKGFYSTECKKDTDSATPNGHNYGFSFKDCKYGLYHDGRMGEGVMFTNVTIDACDYGCYASEVSGGTLQLLGWEFNNQGTDKIDIYVDPKSGSKVHLQQSTINSGRLVINGGSFAAIDNKFNNNAPQVELNKNSRGVLLGNTWKNARNISEKNAFENSIDDTSLGLKALPTYTQFTERNTKPTGTYFEVVNPGSKDRFNVGNDKTSDINAALQRAKNAGGGIVFLPPGHYKIEGQIVIPSGVELKGSTDVGTFPLGPGSYLDVYNRNSVAVLMKANSGIRGVHFDYPEQVRCTVIPNNVIDFPFTIKGDGDNIYIVNVGTRCSNRGVDLAGCNNFYINYLTGYFFREGVNVKNSSNGIIANMQCNTQVYNNGYETKYGQFPNSQSDGCAASTDPYAYNSKNLNFLTMESVTDIFLYNDFNYNTLNGIIFKDNVSGKAIGFALDDDRTGLYLDGNNIKFEFVNLQCVALERNGADPKQSSYITATSNYGANSEITLFGSDYWGNSTLAAVQMDSGAAGTINLYESNFMQINSGDAFKVNGGTLNIINSTIASPSGDLVKQSGSGKVNIIGSFANVTGNPTTNKYNSQAGKASDKVSIDRSGWTVIASYSNGGDNTNEAKKAIDGNTSTSWTSGWQSQGTGQGEVWFKVDMGKATEINEIMLEYSNAPNDGPQTYQLQVSNDGNNWNTVASGNGGSNLTIIEFDKQNVRYFRVVKPASTKSNFWAIYELYAFNMDESKPSGQLSPYGGTRWAIPGTIQAENFDNGGEGVAYHDNEVANQGGYYRTDEGVDLGNGGTGYNIGWTNNGEWTKYSVTVSAAGNYTLKASVSSDAAAAGSFSVAFDDVDVTGNIAVQSTGWGNYVDVEKTGISLTAGDHIMTFNCKGGMNIDYFTFTKEAGANTPFNGPHNIYDGAVLEAEDFDNGGEGVAYHDQEVGHQNAGQTIVYRDNVDVEIETYSAGNYNIGFTNEGEWLLYTINVTQEGKYTIKANAASGNTNGKYAFELDGKSVGLVTSVPNTGGWSTWQDVSTEGIDLTAGTHQLKWYTYGGMNLNKFTFARTGDIGGGGSGDTKEMYNPLFTEFSSPLYTGAGTGHMYTADPSAHVFNDVLYVYASHDMEPALGCDRMDRYHIFSTTDMKNWTDNGEIFGSGDVSWGRSEGGFMWAPDCAYNPNNKTYYYYFPHPSGTDWGATWKIGIATSKDPAKNFTVQGYISGLESLIDPCVFVDDDGQPYIYHGGGGRCMGGKLDKNDWTKLDGTMTKMEGLNDFHEATWVHKYNGKYYLSYADNHGDDGNQLKYAMSDSPLGPWTSMGVFLYATGCDTSHGSIVEYKGQWYAFYHTSNASGEYNLRSVCFDKLYYNADGSIQVVKNWGEPYNGTHTIAVKNNTTDIALKLEAEDFNTGSHYGYWDKTTGNAGGKYRTDVNVDINSNGGVTYIENMQKGEWLRYTINAEKAGNYDIDFYVASGNADGKFHVSVNGTKKSSEISVPNTGGWTTWQKVTVANIPLKAGEQYIDIRINGAFNFDRMEIRNAQPYKGTPYNGPHNIYNNAVLEAEDFDNGGQGVAYYDTDDENKAGAYRTDVGVDIETSAGSTHISWTSGGEWTKYTMNVTEAGTYDIDVRVSTGNGASGTLSLTIDDVYEYPSVGTTTADWSTYTTITVKNVTLTTGTHYLTMTIGGNINVDKYTFKKTSGEVITITGVTVNGAPSGSVTVGNSVTLTATVTGTGGTIPQTVNWSSSNANIKVNNGVVTATAAGTATITATSTADNSKKGTASITFVAGNIPVESVQIGATSNKVLVGGQVTLSATITPNNATNKNVTYSVVSGPGTVNGDKLSATGTGTIVVKVTTQDGNKTSQMSITATDCDATGAVDLVVEDIDWYPRNMINNGEHVTFVITVKNQGGTALSKDSKLGVLIQMDGAENYVANSNTYIWSDYYKSNNLPADIQPCGTMILETNGGDCGTDVGYWTATTNGSHSVKAWVDDGNIIAESNDNNNTLTKTLIVGTPTDVEEVASEGLSIKVEGKTVKVSGAEIGDNITVFSILGVKEISFKAKEKVETIELPAGVHVVRVANKVAEKVLIAK